MDRYSVIVVADETAPVRRFDVRKDTVKRAIWAASAVALCLTLGLVDYVRIRVAQLELDSLRAEAIEQREQIAEFDRTLTDVQGKLERIREFERKVRIIANLPGSAGTGGEEVTEFVSDRVPTDAKPIEPVPTSDEAGSNVPSPQANHADSEVLDAVDAHNARQRDAERLGRSALQQEQSLALLTDQLDAKRERLASTPAIWPSDGWMTSRFGVRVSPFTQRKQFHAGIDIAGERGTDIVASAKGRVAFSGVRGPLGNSVIIDHGHGMRTLYGHTDELYVERGETVDRGQRIAALGSSGRSTGPHLHYVVELKGKAVDPLDYIFD